MDQETDLQREARVSAIQAIRSISNWLYWKTPFANAGETSPSSTSMSLRNLKLIAAPKESSTESEPNIGKIRDAAAARKQPKRNSNRGTMSHTSHPDEDDYWTPLSNALPAAASTSQSNSFNVSRSSKPNTPAAAAGIGGKRSWKQTMQDGDNISGSKIKWVLPMGPALAAALLIAKLQGDEAATTTSLGGGGLKEHIYGSVALEIVNSSWLQIVLVGITWYIIGMIIVQLADGLQSRKG